jgi:hypothetical protein
MNNGLKLWVWEGDGVLTDYTDGLVCVLAATEEEAWSELKKVSDVAHDALRERDLRPRSYDQPSAFYVWGGS